MKKAEVGDRIVIEVKEACLQRKAGWLYCTAHRRAMRTKVEADSHFAQPGEHRIAWLCLLHGPEVL
jgi:hypothetical protein